MQQRNEEDAASQVSAGVVAAAPSSMIAAATETDGEGTSIVAEPEAVGSAETEEHIQRILLAIDSFTRKVRRPSRTCTDSTLIIL